MWDLHSLLEVYEVAYIYLLISLDVAQIWREKSGFLISETWHTLVLLGRYYGDWFLSSEVTAKLFFPTLKLFFNLLTQTSHLVLSHQHSLLILHLVPDLQPPHTHLLFAQIFWWLLVWSPSTVAALCSSWISACDPHSPGHGDQRRMMNSHLPSCYKNKTGVQVTLGFRICRFGKLSQTRMLLMCTHIWKSM